MGVAWPAAIGIIGDKAMAAKIGGLIDQAARVLKAAGAEEVYVFGSAAMGNLRPGSDGDLAVVGLPPAVFFRAMGQAERVLPRSLDRVILDHENPFTRYLKGARELRRVG